MLIPAQSLLQRTALVLGWLFLLCGILVGCATHPGYSNKDYGPSSAVDVSHIPDAVPRAEPRTIAGNKSPYTVLGKTYYVLPASKGYKERGIASWYGNKFHGRNTSNGEVYNIYGMTAAHKTLPIPSYVRVRNLNNNKVIVVRVNDRGPFHAGRIIDLSYAGAKKLGFLDQGTAPVEVEALEPLSATINSGSAVVPSVIANPVPQSAGLYSEPLGDNPVNGESFLPDNTFLQVGAFAKLTSAQSLRESVQRFTQFPVFISKLEQLPVLYRVRIGPVKKLADAHNLQERLRENGMPAAHIVYH